MWFTFNQNVFDINRTLIIRIQKSCQITQDFAIRYWQVQMDVAREIYVSKVDCTVNLLGSFLPDMNCRLQGDLKNLLQKCVDSILTELKFKFFK